MCGSTGQQQQISDAQQQMYTTLTNNYNTAFGQDQAITSALTAQFQPILAAGPSQTGFSTGENTSLNTSASENIAQNYAAAQKATAQVLASRGGGNTLLPSSVNANLLAQNTNEAAQQRSQAQNTINQANYAQGYQNWQTAANVLGQTASLINPLGYASSATNAGTAAATTANQIAQQNNSVWNAAIGALGSLGGAAVTGGLNMLGANRTTTPQIASSNPLIQGYTSLQNLPAPFMPSSAGSMASVTPTF
jgi:hypothetical protein